MDENEILVRMMCERFQREEPVVLVSLLNLKGSSPRHEGSKMLVSEDGKPAGLSGEASWRLQLSVKQRMH
jgi:xanthine/CO dehydrogenase XdhC/CoxF family maturation factor